MKMGTVVRNIPRSAADQLKTLSQCGVATVHEAMGRTGLMQPYMRPIYAGAQVAGNAVTVLAHPGDNWMLHVAAELCCPGDLLVVAVSAENTDGMFGELLATSMHARGVQALVIDAGCRDLAELTRMKFPVWSRAVSAKGTIKATLGNVNTPIICAGCLVHAGDAVIADDDGVAVVPHKEIAGVISASQQRIAREDTKRARLAAGELGMDIENMRPALKELGLTYYETLEQVPGMEKA
jgi:4-hydroxy-4-methyl-2-oxoglutarate aldolase